MPKCMGVLEWILLPLVILLERPWTLPAPGATTWWAIVGLALLSTAAAYVIYFRVLASAGATNLLLVTFLIPVSALLLGTLILGERLEMQHFIGMTLIGVGLGAIDGRPCERIRIILSEGQITTALHPHKKAPTETRGLRRRPGGLTGKEL